MPAFKCPNCAVTLSAEGKAGTKARCPRCMKVVTFTAAAPKSAGQPPAPPKPPAGPPPMVETLCPHCAEPVNPSAAKCPHCGEPLSDALRAKAESRHRLEQRRLGELAENALVAGRLVNPGTAAVLAVVPAVFQVFGVGHLYAGRLLAGFLWLFTCLFLAYCFASFGLLLGIITLGIGGVLVMWAWLFVWAFLAVLSANSAYRAAQALNDDLLRYGAE